MLDTELKTLEKKQKDNQRQLEKFELQQRLLKIEMEKIELERQLKEHMDSIERSESKSFDSIASPRRQLDKHVVKLTVRRPRKDLNSSMNQNSHHLLSTMDQGNEERQVVSRFSQAKRSRLLDDTDDYNQTLKVPKQFAQRSIERSAETITVNK